MTAADMGTVLSIGGSQIITAIPGALWVAVQVLGCLALTGITGFGLLWLYSIWDDRRTRRRRLRVPTEPNPVLRAYRDKCPWCDSHECLDKTQCNCVVPCGSWLCEVKEASRG